MPKPEHHRGTDPILLAAAHPDDEIIGAGIQLCRWDPTRLIILHTTDGSPRDRENREEYAHQRRRELYRALDLAGIRPDQCMQFKYVDQESHLNLVELTARLKVLIEELKPGAIYTHPYEGGHPDHDSLAFAAAHASPANVFEFTSYHAGPTGLVTGEFLNGGETQTLDLTEQEQGLKRKMFECFESQHKVLSDFKITSEKFRPAPKYDFAQAPHSGILHYEKLGWNITGNKWREKAAEATELLASRSML